MVIVMLYTLRWCTIWKNITTVGSGSDCFYFYGDRTIKYFMIMKETCKVTFVNLLIPSSRKIYNLHSKPDLKY